MSSEHSWLCGGQLEVPAVWYTQGQAEREEKMEPVSGTMPISERF